MQFTQSQESVDRIPTQMVVIPIGKDLTPLHRGCLGLVDWRLNGLISRMRVGKKITGASGEKTLLPTGNKLRAPYVLLYGTAGSKGGSKPQLIQGIFQSLEQMKVQEAVITLEEGPFSESDFKNIPKNSSLKSLTFVETAPHV